MAHKDCIALALAFALTSATARSQSSLDWIDRQSAPQPSICGAGGCSFDAAGNVVASGSVGWSTGTTSDIRLVKYSPAGAVLWSRTYGAPGINDGAIALEIGAGGLIHELSAFGLSGNVQGRISTWDPSGNPAWTALLPIGCNLQGMVVGAQGELLCHGYQGQNA